MENKLLKISKNRMVTLLAKTSKSEISTALNDEDILVGAEFEFKVEGLDRGDWAYMVERFLEDDPVGRPFVEYEVGGYHEVPLSLGDTHWGIEHDASVGDVGMELKNPPMSVPEFVKICPRVFDWIEEKDGYTDNDCGLHLSMSIRGESNLADKLDIVKLHMFTEEPLISKYFKGRVGSGYVKSIRNKIRNQGKIDRDDLRKILDYDKIKKALSRGHSDAINIEHLTNSRSGRIEFRYAGHANYHKRWPEIKYMLGLYAHYMKLAYDPDYKRKEYLIKLVREIDYRLGSKESGSVGQYTYDVASPTRFNESDMEQIKQLIIEGSQIDPTGIEKRLNRAKLIGLFRRGEEGISVAAIKLPYDSYKRKIFGKAEIPDLADQYKYEFGWAYTKPDIREKGLMKRIMKKMMRDVGNQKVFATTKTNNRVMKHLLEKFGFRPEGEPYPSISSGEIQIYLYN